MNFIPKNPWVAVAVLGGIAVAGYVLFEEFNKTVNTASNSVSSLPGNLISSTASGIHSAWDTLIYDPLHDLFTGNNSSAAPAAAPSSATSQLVSPS